MRSRLYIAICPSHLTLEALGNPFRHCDETIERRVRRRGSSSWLRVRSRGGPQTPESGSLFELMPAPPLLTRPGNLVAILLTAGFLSAACPSPTNPSQGTGIFEGLYLQGFEVSAFAPCGKGSPDSETGYWLTGSGDFNERYNALATTRGPNAFGPVVHTKFTGTLSAEGRYGHLGAYKREVAVTKVTEMSIRSACP